MPNGASSAHRLAPKLSTVVREGYDLDRLRRDLVAGLTVAVVALPLSMAIAVASGVSPVRGLYAAIFGGAVVSLLGGSRHQIGGPAGAFIVLVSGAAAAFGTLGLLTCVFVSGLAILLMGLLRLGGVVRRMPEPVVLGFTVGIALTIAISQVKDVLGLRPAGPEPGPLVDKALALLKAVPTAKAEPLALALGVVAIILALRRLAPRWPGMLIAVAAATLIAPALGGHAATVGGQFGGLPSGVPTPALPPLSFQAMGRFAPTIAAFAVLGAIESLLSAKVADAMTGRVHRSNMELIAQGLANMVSAVFGGISVTGTIARTATNIRAGAQTPVSGLIHSLALLLVLLLAAPLAGFIPLSALAGVLMVVCWTMVDRRELALTLRSGASAAIFLATLAGVIFKDLIAGIGVGCLLAGALHLIRRRAALAPESP